MCTFCLKGYIIFYEAGSICRANRKAVHCTNLVDVVFQSPHFPYWQWMVRSANIIERHKEQKMKRATIPLPSFAYSTSTHIQY